jgi:hypothetical protein
VLAAEADHRLRATQEQLRDVLGACVQLSPGYRRLLQMALEGLKLLEQHLDQLDKEISVLLNQHQEAVQRLAEVPGLGVDSAHQIIAEIGAAAAVFPSGKNLSSWVGVCPGDEQSAAVSKSTRSPKRNRNLRRILNQAAHAAIKVKGKLLKLSSQANIRKQEWTAAGFPLVCAETLAYGLENATFGAQPLGDWELPAQIIEAVSTHHRPEHSQSELAALICVAEDLMALASQTNSADLVPALRRTAACVTIESHPTELDEFVRDSSIRRESA